jgi:hypothetical protein
LDGTVAGFGTVFGKNSVIVSGLSMAEQFSPVWAK